MMKATKLFSILSAVWVALSITACTQDDDYKTPPIIDNSEELNVTFTINQVKELYEETGSGVISFNSVGEGLVLEGYVISNDEAGNFYKTLIIQDQPEDPTAGIQIDIDETTLYSLYKPGQKVYVKLNGLGVEEQNGVLHIGTVEDDAVQRISGLTYTDYIVRSATRTTITPLVISPEDYSDDYINMLIQLDNMQLSTDELGSPYANLDDTFTVNRNLQNCEDGSMTILRNSGYASFKSQLFPQGSGAIVAVFSKYNNDYQLFIRDTEDVMFNGDRCTYSVGIYNPIAPVSMPFTEDFENETAGYDEYVDIDGWANYNVSEGATIFEVRSFSNNNYAQISAYNSGENNLDAWLITPHVIVDNTTENPVLTFETNDGYYNGDALSVFIATDFNGEIDAANWEEVNATISSGNSSGYGTFVTSGEVNLSAYVGETIVVGFQYQGGDSDVTSTYQIDNVYLGASTTGGGSGGGNTGSSESISEDFESGTAYEAVDLTGWTNYNANNGSDLFEFRSYNDNMYAQASAYNSDDDPYNLWLVTPGVDLADATEAALSFDTKDGYNNGEALTVYVSTDFTGDPTTATWTELTGYTLSSGNTNGYADNFTNSGAIDLSDYTGETVYIGFEYNGSPNGVTTTYQIDNVSLTAN